jgi:hypothetical protein
VDRRRYQVPQRLRGREQGCGHRIDRAFANAFRGAEEALVGLIASGKLEFQGLADSILADVTRMAVRETSRPR